MEHTRVWNQEQRCWTLGKFEMSNKQILDKYCMCMERGRYGTAESLSLRMEGIARTKPLKWEWLNADLKAFAFRPKINIHQYQR